MQRYRIAVIEPIIEAADPRVVLDLDRGDGQLAHRLAALCRERDIALHVAHPDPSFDPEALEQLGGDAVRVQRAGAVRAASECTDVGVAIVDADPNWYTVMQVLQELESRARQDGHEPPVVVVHDVRWPFGRRDGYRDPEAIPEGARQPAGRDGVVPGRRGLDPEGLQTGLWHALSDDGDRNGVRTAIEDFAEQSERDWVIADLPGLGGIAVVAEVQLVRGNAALARVLHDLRSPEFLEDHCRRVDMERARAETALQAARRAAAALEAEQRDVAERAATQAGALAAATEAHRAEADDLRAEVRRSQERADALEHELSDARVAVASLQARVAELDAAVREQRADRERLIAAASTGERERAVAETRLEALERSSAAIEAELRSGRDRLERQLAANEQERTQLRIDLTRRDAELQSLRAERTVLQSRVDGDAQRVADAVVAAERVREQLGRAEAARERERQALADAERRAGILEREVEARTNELGATRDQERLLSSRTADLDRQLVAAQGDLRTHRAARETLEAEREVVRAQLERAIASRSWRLGHKTTMLMRRLTFRRPQSDAGALDKALQTVSRPLPAAQLPAAESDMRPILRSWAQEPSQQSTTRS
ncbi:coiled-coil domain-containing protein [Capillimicrobium parvum]|uniref:Uncharacterized protein n=1 Tax=Capillimicrobium parvum TaxID=2884022 RepID=A0A9E6Y2J0_9ACTN|nr:hypothetical protein [Capillimicrobium parvum]UGS38824.1 hypothetical protein DSM104329_05254 [Capillimicrobium parvum]